LSILPASGVEFPARVDVAIVGGGAAGLVAALAASEAGAEVAVIERDATPSGSTALSSGMVPAAGTRIQAARGVLDTAEIMAADVQRKAKDENDAALVLAACRAVAPAVDWLKERHGVPFELVEGFLYPGHSCARMHAPPSRTGAELIGALLRAAERAQVPILTSACVTSLFADDDGRVAGLEIERPGGVAERIGADAVILACCGFGGDPGMVRDFIPEMGDALFCGHTGNRGDAVHWGRALGAELRNMSAYQGHGSVATPHNILVTWALMMEGGIQVNAEGRRFSNEHEGYSEQAMRVIRQPGGIAWNIYDERLHNLGRQFEDYRQAEEAGAVRRGDTLAAIAQATGVPATALAETLAAVEAAAAGQAADRFGREFATRPTLRPPYFAIKVTGALFHTQGGLAVDVDARVLRTDGRPLPNLYAAGGAMCGLSGRRVEGYLSGNGLLSAVAFGWLAGHAAGTQR